MQTKSRMTAAVALAIVIVSDSVVTAETNSYFDKQYEFATLKTFTFKD